MNKKKQQQLKFKTNCPKSSINTTLLWLGFVKKIFKFQLKLCENIIKFIDISLQVLVISSLLQSNKKQKYILF